MTVLVSIPDHFASRPNSLGSTCVVDTNYQLFRNKVETTEFHLTISNSFQLTLDKPEWNKLYPITRINPNFLAQSYRHNIYMWISNSPNGYPIGQSSIGNIKYPPLVLDIDHSDAHFIIATQGTNTIQLKPNTYWINFWYYGNHPYTFIRKSFTQLGI